MWYRNSNDGYRSSEDNSEIDTEQQPIQQPIPYPFSPNPRGRDRSPHNLTEDQFYDFHDTRDNHHNNTLGNFFNNPQASQTWTLVPAARLKKIWGDYSRYGFVRDERGLDEIANTMITNVHKLETNTIMSGHTSRSPEEFADSHGYEYNEDQHIDNFMDHITDENGQWRISDYALEPLMDDAARVYASQTPEQKLLMLDRMLNRIHQRSDIAAMFVEGGSRTLDEIASGV